MTTLLNLYAGAVLSFRPLTLSEWPDFVTLFEEHGVQDSCWCMYWRTTRAECQRGYGTGNRQAIQAIVESGVVPGILAYHAGKSVGWCSVGAQTDYAIISLIELPCISPAAQASESATRRRKHHQ
jgi:hypothetical protein